MAIIFSPWPFDKWSVNLIGPPLKGRESANFAIIAINYFTKWVEAKPLAKIMEVNTFMFLWNNILCRFEIFHSIVFNNGKQFDNKKVKDLGDELRIKK